MQIFVDADACPVVAIIEKIAKDNSVPVMLLCDTNHVLSSTYSKVVVVGAGADANIINLRLDITHLYYPAKNSFQKGRLKRREIFTELLLYTLTT